MKTRKLLSITSAIAVAVGLLASRPVGAWAQTEAPIVNPGFELPDMGKISDGYDDAGKDVPGWNNATLISGTTNSNTGIENKNSNNHSGSYGGYAMGGDPGGYQITTNVMSFGQVYTLTWYGQNEYGSSDEETALISGSATNDPYTSVTDLAVSHVTSFSGWSQYTLTHTAGSADVGKLIGIRFRNNGAAGGCWCTWDDFDLTYVQGPSTPSVTTQPAGYTAYYGSPATFSVVAAGPDLAYQWKAGAVGSGIYTNVPGATSATLTVSYAAAGADYVAHVSNTAGSVDSSPATLTITPVTYDASGLVNAGFELPALGKINDGFDDLTGKDVPGWRNAGPNQYDEGIDSAGQGHSGTYAAYLHRGNDGAYQISTNKMHLGDSITMTWYERDSWHGVDEMVRILGASSMDATIGNTTILSGITNEVTGWWSQKTLNYTAGAGDVGNFVGIAFQTVPTANPGSSDGWADFDDFAITITPANAAPVIVTAPGNQTDWLASTATFNVLASGGGLGYQWQAGTVGSGIYTNINNGGQFSGATTASLSIANIAVANGLDYVVIVTNSVGSVTSAPPATLTVNTASPTVDTQPASWVAYQYTTTSVSASVSGATSYQWQAGVVGSGIYHNLSNGSHYSGVNSNVLTITDVAVSDGMDYVLVASNAGGTSTSSAATLTVVPVLYLQGFDPAVPTNGIGYTGWVLSGGPASGGLSDGGWPGTVAFAAAGATNVPQAFYTTTFIENGSYSNYMAFPVINQTNAPNLTFSFDYNSYWQATSTHTYFCVQMNWGQWYISPEVAQATGNEQTAILSWDPTASSWSQFTVSGPGTNNESATATVIGGVATSNLDGYITGAGMVSLHDATSNNGFWVKLDNFKIYANSYTAVSGLSLAKSGANEQLSWGYGTLLQSTNVAGPWTPLNGTSPMTITPTNKADFYRLQLP